MPGVSFSTSYEMRFSLEHYLITGFTGKIVFGVTVSMTWIYWAKLYDSRFQARCLAARMQEDWWIYGYDSPKEVEVFRSKRGRYGVRYIWQ